MRKALRILYLLTGVACVAYYFVLWRASRFGLSLSWIWPVAGAALIAAGVLCALPRLPGWVRVAWRTLLCCGLAFVIALEALVVSGMRATAPAGQDYLIVLGARVESDGPSPALTRRLNAVMEILDDHPDALIIASGGQGADEPMSEARCIRDELIARGVDPERVLMEDRSANTAENIAFSKALMDDAEHAAVGIVTNNFHVWRAVRLARAAGLSNATGIAAKYTGPTLFHYMIREAVGITMDFLRGNLT